MSDGLTYWKSLRELYDRDSVSEQKAQEFMEGVTDDFKLSDLSAMSRKQFLALLTASAAFAAAGCSNYRDEGEIVPYTKKPEEITPGVPNYYASTCTGCKQACGILIKTREGRPIKIDGNPDHPVNQGKICPAGQASILNLYDPYRLRGPVYGSKSGKSGSLTWNQVDDEVLRHLDECARTSKEIAIITHSLQSPSTAKVLEDFKARYPTTRLYSYDLFNDVNRRRAWQACYGTTELPTLEWGKAKVILSLESDFIGAEGMTIEQIREFTNGRDIMKSKDFNRLYVVEGTLSLTGINADYRLRLRPDAQLDFVLALINEIALVRKKGTVRGPLQTLVSSVTLKSFADQQGLSGEVLQQLVDDLIQRAGESIVLAGDKLPTEVHTAVNYLNEILGNTKLYRMTEETVSYSSPASTQELEELVKRMKSGSVGMVVHFDTNPVYHLAQGFGYAEALKSVPVSVSLVEADNETSQLCTYVLPVHHAYESWGDFKIRTGMYSLQQPVIAPLYDTRQKEAVLLAWIHGLGSFKETMYHEYIMSRWEKEVVPSLSKRVDFKTFWYASLHDGVVTTGEKATRAVRFRSPALEKPGPSSSGYAVMLTPNYSVGDGSFATNGWLQELPHPISRVVWDNYAAISKKTADELGVEDNSSIEVSLPQGTQTFPVLVQPGQADGLISVQLGYGRWNAGSVGTWVGANANVLLSKDALVGPRVYTGAKVSNAHQEHKLVTTQEHHSLDDAFLKDIDRKRGVIRDGTVAEYKNDPQFLHHEKVELFDITKRVEYTGVKWAMAIDMNKCVGCQACVTSCNVENNVPVVGKDQAGRGREMHWIRIDRYYSGTVEEPVPSHMPMLCQQCDNAPCENVCPVAATNHSPDGLNQMVYNRCVGTKYCSNNCPYKVRRFNFFDWHEYFDNGYFYEEPMNLMYNPEVTLRSRGVMEKCTFCIQRIMAARQHAVEQGKPLKGSDVKTACQEACPATAIVFGDMNDPESEIARYRSHELGYHVLEEVNARPNITYLAKLRNVQSEKNS
jgi:MoCo/4Fe-4S cofactor protein with predicted Tat translocation signal